MCRAEPEPVSGYTPADFITYSEDKQQQCHHNADIMVDAPLEQCYAAWSDWTKLLDTFDLIGQVSAAAAHLLWASAGLFVATTLSCVPAW